MTSQPPPDSPFDPQQSAAQSTASSGASPSLHDSREAKETAQSAKESIKEKSTAAAKNLKETGRDYASEKKEGVAERIGHYGKEFEEVARRFEEDDPNIAWLTRSAADGLNGLAEHLRRNDFRDLWLEAEGMARRHPLAVMGAMFAAGAVVGSFVKSARTDDEYDEWDGPSANDPAYGGYSPAEDDLLASPTGVSTQDI